MPNLHLFQQYKKFLPNLTNWSSCPDLLDVSGVHGRSTLWLALETHCKPPDSTVCMPCREVHQQLLGLLLPLLVSHEASLKYPFCKCPGDARNTPRFLPNPHSYRNHTA